MRSAPGASSRCWERWMMRNVWRKAAQAADVVVNAASADHMGAVAALLGALAGSGKPFIHTSGSSIVGTRARGHRSDADL